MLAHVLILLYKGERVVIGRLTQRDEIEYINKIFTKRIFPVLTPLAVDPSHPFPYISGLSLNLAVLVKQPDTNEELFARVKVPASLPRCMETDVMGQLPEALVLGKSS